MKIKTILIVAICTMITAITYHLFTLRYLEFLLLPLLIAVERIARVVSVNIKTMRVLANKVGESNFNDAKKIKMYDCLESAANEVMCNLYFIFGMLFISAIAAVCSNFYILYEYTQPIILLCFLLSIYPCYDIIVVNSALDRINDKSDIINLASEYQKKHDIK